MRERTSYTDAPLRTELVWKPYAHSNVRSPRRGALVGTLWGVEVDGKSTGRGVAYQFGLISGEVRTVWWDGTMWGDVPEFYDVDTGEHVARNPLAVAWFARLEDVEAP
jgi:hypothetical protein